MDKAGPARGERGRAAGTPGGRARYCGPSASLPGLDQNFATGCERSDRQQQIQFLMLQRTFLTNANACVRSSLSLFLPLPPRISKGNT